MRIFTVVMRNNKCHLSKFRNKKDFPNLVVRLGVPILTPLGFRADLSPGTVFLLTEMETISKMLSPLAPLRPEET